METQQNKAVCRGQKWELCPCTCWGRAGYVQTDDNVHLNRYFGFWSGFISPLPHFSLFTSFVHSFSSFFSGLFFISLYLIKFFRHNCFFLAKLLLPSFFFFFFVNKWRTEMQEGQNRGKASPRELQLSIWRGLWQEHTPQLPGFALLLSHSVRCSLSFSPAKSPGETCHQLTLSFPTKALAGCWCQFLVSPAIMDSRWYSLSQL